MREEVDSKLESSMLKIPKIKNIQIPKLKKAKEVMQPKLRGK